MSAAKLLGSALLCCLVSLGCQETREPTITLTQSQWEEVKKEILPAKTRPIVICSPTCPTNPLVPLNFERMPSYLCSRVQSKSRDHRPR